MNASLFRTRRTERGQILPLFALMLVALIAITGLVIDVSNAYASRRFYRAAADAAALAGAADLQTTTRAITTQNRTDARQHALDALVAQLHATGACGQPTTSNIIDCALTGTPYLVSIQTPSPSCVTCSLGQAVQVTVKNPTFGLTFARVLGFSQYSVASTGVAGLQFTSRYALMTLQPPKPRNNGSDANLNKDIIVNGNNTKLNILQGDIGSNTSATTTNAGYIQLADGYFIWHYDDLTAIGDTWSKDALGKPEGQQLADLLLDPNYPRANFTSPPAVAFATQAAGEIACTGADYPTDYATIFALGAVKCYQPGIYNDPQGFRVGTGSGIPDVAYLMPGAYRLPQGMTVRGSLLGGAVSNRHGVLLSFPRSQLLDANNAANFLLNVGGQTCTQDSCRALPAQDAAGTEIKTPSGLFISIEVDVDPGCYSGTTPLDSSTCAVAQNHTLNLAGTGRLAVAGVINAPSDNVSINGNSAQQSLFGQIVSWSATYTGGSTLNQSYPGGLEIGIPRLDAACTAPGTSCNP